MKLTVPHLFLKIILPATLVLMVSCKSSLFKGMEKTGKTTVKIEQLYPIQPVSNITTNYELQITRKSNTVDGILSVMPDETDKSIRLVYTSLFGINVFDISFTPNKKMQVNHCLPQLEHKLILRTLLRDFRLIFFLNLDDTFEAKTYQKVYTSGESAIMGEQDQMILNKGYATKSRRGRKCYYLTSEIEQHIEKIKENDKLTGCEATFDYAEGSNEPEEITIHHPVLKTTLKLKKLSEEREESSDMTENSQENIEDSIDPTEDE